MTDKRIDWKDVANSQFSKALALAIALMLFAFFSAGRSDTEFKKSESSQASIADVPTDMREKEETPQDQEVKVDIPMTISEELATSSNPDIEAAQIAALQQFGDLQKTGISGGNDDRPFDFVPYEDPPQWVTPPKPVYPDFAQRAGIQGTVWLEVDVYKDGTVGDVRVKKSVNPGPGGLDEAAVMAVRSIRFYPGKSGGNPVDTTVNVPVEFRKN